jgi:hypothetical protein
VIDVSATQYEENKNEVMKEFAEFMQNNENATLKDFYAYLANKLNEEESND